MECERALECVDAYINRTLSDHETEDFIKHVRRCPKCFDELETYYIIDMAVKYLDEVEDQTFNITQQLKEDIEGQLQRIKKKKRIVKGLVLAGSALGVVALIGLVWFGYIVIW